MGNITAILVKELRKRTGIGILECKKALLHTNGDIELAIDNIRKSGQVKAAKKAGHITSEGIILTKIHPNSKYGVIFELNCETDFVAKDDIFKTFGKKIITTALNESISNVQILQNRFEEERTTLITKVGENITIRRLSFLEGNIIQSYLHGTRIGVIVSATGTNKELIKHIAMHITASKPEYVHPHDIPDNIISREYQIQLDIAMQSGKLFQIAEKIVKGRMQKFIDNISLMGQPFIMDLNKTISELLKEHNIQINNFIRFEIGEGITNN